MIRTRWKYKGITHPCANPYMNKPFISRKMSIVEIIRRGKKKKKGRKPFFRPCTHTYQSEWIVLWTKHSALVLLIAGTHTAALEFIFFHRKGYVLFNFLNICYQLLTPYLFIIIFFLLPFSHVLQHIFVEIESREEKRKYKCER